MGLRDLFQSDDSRLAKEFSDVFREVVAEAVVLNRKAVGGPVPTKQLTELAIRKASMIVGNKYDLSQEQLTRIVALGLKKYEDFAWKLEQPRPNSKGHPSTIHRCAA
jgi:hypothetical protein